MISLVRVQEELRERSGVLVPVYMPPSDQREVQERLLDEHVESLLAHVKPERVCLCVDGRDKGEDHVKTLTDRLGVRAKYLNDNGGKLNALRGAAEEMLNSEGLEYLITTDSDGDHFANEMANFVRAAMSMRETHEVEEVILVGRRSSTHRPMGYLRGELEELASRTLTDLLQHHAVASGRPLNLEYVTPIEAYPDFHSGYKLMTRRVAQCVLKDTPELAGVGVDTYYRHAVEAVLVVESLLAGATLGVVQRSTYNEQPVTTFGRLKQSKLCADMIIWPAKRLEVPGEFVRQYVDNHLSRLLLGTLVPQGKDEMNQVRREILSAFGLDSDDLDGVRGPSFL